MLLQSVSDTSMSGSGCFILGVLTYTIPSFPARTALPRPRSPLGISIAAFKTWSSRTEFPMAKPERQRDRLIGLSLVC